jgi:glutamine---fructose-6-phosphate transaminase (isomerizing)
VNSDGAAEHHLPLRAGLERAVPASKTYTAQLLAVAMLSAAWADDDEAARALDAVPGLVDDAVRSAAAGAARAAEWRDAQRLVVLGRGTLFGTAYEVALKVKETCRVVAEPHSVADFLHGPVAVLDADLRAIVVAPSSPADADLDAVIARLVDGGASVAAISDRDDVLGRVAIPLRVPRAPEHLAPLPCAVAGQLFSQALARARGFDPDAPQGLAKVTETR